MNKEKCMEIISNGLYENYNIAISLSKRKQLFEDSFKIISKHISDMENDLSINNDYDFDTIEKSVKFALDYVVDRHMNEELIHFFKAWFEIVYNWNNNVEKNESINRDCKSGLRILDQNLSIRESIGTMKRCNEQMKRFVNWMPPAFEVSKHILSRLDNDGE